MDNALKHFTTANQLAGQAGRGALALDAGVQMQMPLTSRQLAKATEVLTQVQQIAKVKATPQERQICAMLAQAHFNQQQVEPALKRSTCLANQSRDQGPKNVTSRLVQCWILPVGVENPVSP